VRLSRESCGFGPRDNKRYNPGSDGVNERHLLHYPGACRVFRDIEMEDLASTVFDDEKTTEYAQLLTEGKDLEAEAVAQTEEGAKTGEEAHEKWNHELGLIA
jgi:hypothetical protein